MPIFLDRSITSGVARIFPLVFSAVFDGELAFIYSDESKKKSILATPLTTCIMTNVLSRTLKHITPVQRMMRVRNDFREMDV